MAAGGWGLTGASFPIRTIIPKEDSAMNAGAYRKEGSKSKPKPIIKRREPKTPMEKKLERKRTDLRSQSGFTLLEMMSMLVILGVIFSVVIHRFSDITDTAYRKALESAIQELNIRETLIWSDFKISLDGWQDDNNVFTRLDTKLGGGFYWNPSAGKLGGDLHFGPHKFTLVRSPSTIKLAGSWKE